MKYLFSQLGPYFYRYRWLLIWGGLSIIISNLFAVFPAQVFREGIDELAAHVRQSGADMDKPAPDHMISEGLATGLYYGLILLALAILKGIFLFFMRQTLIVMSRKIEYEQKKHLFEKFQTLSLRNLRSLQTGDLMARISEDVSNVRMYVGPGIMYTFNTVTLFIIILAVMLAVNVELTLYVLMPLPLLALAIYLVHRVIIRRTDEQQQQLSTLSNFTQEAFSGIRVLKAYVKENETANRFQQESLEYKRRAMRLVKVDALFFPIIMLMIGLSILFTLWFGGEAVIRGEITLGNITEFMIYVGLLIWPVTALGWVTSLSQRAVASQRRIEEILKMESEIKFPAVAAPPKGYSLEVIDASLTYPESGVAAMKGISLSLPEGQTLGIVGPTGSGKSTLANVMVRLMDPDSGQVLLDGKPISDYTEQQVRSIFGYVQQDVLLFSDSIARNIAFGRSDATREEIEAAARFAGVYDDIMGFPEGFETQIGERGVTLSGGQKQRLSIARAWLIRPRIFILDDALSAVDTQTEEHILQNLKDTTAYGGTPPSLVIVSHRLHSVMHADHILVIENGAITQQGRHEELLQQEGLYARLHLRQQMEQEIILD